MARLASFRSRRQPKALNKDRRPLTRLDHQLNTPMAQCELTGLAEATDAIAAE